MEEKSKYPNGLGAAMERAGMTDPDLAARAGTTKQQIFKLRRGERKLTVDWAHRLAPHLGASLPELLLGVAGAQVKMGEDGLRRGPRPEPTTVPVVIPEYDVRAMGGAGAEDMALDGNGNHVVLAEWTVPEDYLRSYTPSPAAVRIIRIVGDSMEPHYPAGDRVLVDTSHVIPSPPGVYVVWDGLGLVLKHVEVLAGRVPLTARLSSDNPAYAPYEVPVADLRVQGRVMGKWIWK